MLWRRPLKSGNVASHAVVTYSIGSFDVGIKEDVHENGQLENDENRQDNTCQCEVEYEVHLIQDSHLVSEPKTTHVGLQLAE